MYKVIIIKKKAQSLNGKQTTHTSLPGSYIRNKPQVCLYEYGDNISILISNTIFTCVREEHCLICVYTSKHSLPGVYLCLTVRWAGIQQPLPVEPEPGWWPLLLWKLEHAHWWLLLPKKKMWGWDTGCKAHKAAPGIYCHGVLTVRASLEFKASAKCTITCWCPGSYLWFDQHNVRHKHHLYFQTHVFYLVLFISLSPTLSFIYDISVFLLSVLF